MLNFKKNKKTKKKKSHSSYWLKGWETSGTVIDTMSVSNRIAHDMYKLSAAKRAIAKFVTIVTNQRIPVEFNVKGKSYTDGKAVVIGTEVQDPDEFDVVVGLALHEGSHIKLTNFDILKEIQTGTPQSVIDNSLRLGVKGWAKVIKDLLNVVEDRRIDSFIFNQAPGYRNYYRAMYDKFFNSPIIDAGLQSTAKRTETLDSYMYRIINIHNKNTDLTALKGLREIYNLIDLKRIDRLKSTEDAYDVARDIYDVILENVEIAKDQKSDKDDSQEQDENGETEIKELTDQEFEDMLDDMENGGGEDESENDESNDDDQDGNDGSNDEEENDEETDGNGGENDNDQDGDEDNDQDDSDGDGNGEEDETDETPEDKDNGGSCDNDSESNEDEDGDESSDSDGEESKESKPKIKPKTVLIKLSDKQQKILEERIKKQEDFLDGKIKKGTLDTDDNEELTQIEESGSELQNVANNPEDGFGSYKGINVVVVKKMTKRLMESGSFPMASRSYYGGGLQKPFLKEIEEGLRIGKILGRRLQTRGESRTTVYNRQKIGKIDKRMIASLGFGNENVFSYNETDQYKKANLHVSIDASGSMNGSKWRKTMTNVTALCKAVDMIANLNIQVTFRTSIGYSPYVVLAYDSRVDKISKVKELFPSLDVAGVTPEGLCFEAIMKDFLQADINTDSFFLNISDGEPYFGAEDFYYSGSPAFEHTRRMVKKIESLGIQTLSYYVDDYEPVMTNGFRRMYGKSAVTIDINHIGEITKTMNKLFMSKKQ